MEDKWKEKGKTYEKGIEEKEKERGKKESTEKNKKEGKIKE